MTSPGSKPEIREVYRRSEHQLKPWRNGGGSTREVAAFPAGEEDFRWRLSFAEVARSGPFSSFPGIDRLITLVDGPAVALTVDGREHRLERHRPFCFSGDAATAARVSAPSVDFNVMVRRAEVRATASVLRLESAGEAASLESSEGETLLTVLAGAVEVVAGADAEELEAFDVARAVGPLSVGGSGVVQVTRLLPL